MAVEPVSQTTQAAPTDPSSSADQTELQNAFAQGIVQFMGTMMQSLESDVVDAINDDTSTPDAPA